MRRLNAVLLLILLASSLMVISRAEEDYFVIEDVQEMLTAVGAMKNEAADDIYGEQLERAVKVFQKWVNSILGESTIPENGFMDDKTYRALEYAYRNGLIIDIGIETSVDDKTKELASGGKVIVVNQPVVFVTGTAYMRDGIMYMTNSTLGISWTGNDEVENYTLYIQNEAGERQELGTTTDTSRTIDVNKLSDGIYTILVGAMPHGGNYEDIAWGEITFGLSKDGPDNGKDSDENPKQYEASIDANSEPEKIQKIQMQLYSLGLLSVDGLEPGVLDKITLEAVAEFQRIMNEKENKGLEIIDPENTNAVIDGNTVRALMEE